MTKLEKSIRRELKYFGPKLRAGHWGALGHTMGIVSPNFRYLYRAYCDFDGGEITGVRLYGVGDALTAKDYHGDSIDITGPLESYLRGESGWSWGSLIAGIQDAVLLEWGGRRK